LCFLPLYQYIRFAFLLLERQCAIDLSSRIIWSNEHGQIIDHNGNSITNQNWKLRAPRTKSVLRIEFLTKSSVLLDFHISVRCSGFYRAHISKIRTSEPEFLNTGLHSGQISWIRLLCVIVQNENYTIFD